ncbi:MAG: NAD(P)-binding protein [Arenibacterium sp.]
MDGTSGTKKRIAVLGGGTGALFSALALTSLPDADKKFSITVYQLGWRLGGKGASGRRKDQGYRIEEHGLHVWSGFYDNAIRHFKDCLKALGDEPYVYSSFEEAFTPNNNIALAEKLNGEWLSEPWLFRPPDNNAIPGEGGVTLSPLEYLRMLVVLLKSYSQSSVFDGGWTTRAPKGTAGGILGDVDPSGPHPDVFFRIDDLVQTLPEHARDHDPVHLSKIHSETKDAQRQISKRQAEVSINDRKDDDLRRALMVLDLGVAAVRGFVTDGLLLHGFEIIDDDEASEWLRQNGAAPSSVDGALVRAIYSYAFGFNNGMAKRADRAISAGVFLKGVLRLMFTYKGSIFFKMNAAMGDTIFSPIYKLLKRRGVTFKFFHKIDRLGLDTANQHVETIELSLQASLKPGQKEYDPFVRVKNLDCWPSEPNWEQIENGKVLKDSGVDFESAWASRAGYQSLPPLRRGQDFDDVILGISLAALPYVAKSLIDAAPSWQKMIDEVKTTRTQAFQLWFKKSAEELGWPHGETILTAYAAETDTWANMSNLCSVEDWPEGHEPKSSAYFCGPMFDPPHVPVFGDTQYSQKVYEEARARALKWINEAGLLMFPKAFDKKGKFDVKPPFDAKNSKGQTLWKNQNFRGHIEPT